MKKLLILTLVIVAVATFLGTGYRAQASTSLTPEQAAALQQSLDTLKAKLLDLQAQAAAKANVNANMNASPAVLGATLTLRGSVISSADAASLQSALSMLATALTGLQSSFAQNPQLVAGREASVMNVLRGVSGALSGIGNSLQGQQNIAEAPVTPVAPAAPVAQAAPAPVSVSAPAPAPLTAEAPAAPIVTPAAPSEGNLVTVPANTDQGTAQAVSSWSFKNLNWPLVIVIVLVIAAIGLWLFWPTDNDENHSEKPTTPLQPVTPMRSSTTPPHNSYPKAPTQPQQ